MKKVMKILMVTAVFAVFAFAPVNELEVKPAPLESEKICVEEDEFRCVIRDQDGNRVVAACWFCDCDDLLAALLA